jgi:hypothetical protein
MGLRRDLKIQGEKELTAEGRSGAEKRGGERSEERGARKKRARIRGWGSDGGQGEEWRDGSKVVE